MSARIAPVFDRRLNLLAPGHLADAVEVAAAMKMQSVSSWLRGAALERLRNENENGRPKAAV